MSINEVGRVGERKKNRDRVRNKEGRLGQGKVVMLYGMPAWC
jgi:hypothetical protein